MILAAALSVSLPLIGHDKVVVTLKVIARNETSVGWITFPLKGELKLIMNPLQLPDGQPPW
jgi:hypothetical protein